MLRATPSISENSESSTFVENSSRWSADSFRSSSPTLNYPPSSTPKPPTLSLGSDVKYTYLDNTSHEPGGSGDRTRWCETFLWVLLLIFINAIYAIWLCFYLKIYIHPVPRTALNKTKSGFYAYQTFLYIVAILVGSVDLLVIGRWGPWNWENRKRLNVPVYWALIVIFSCLGLVVAGIVWTGGWTIAYIMQSLAWSHGCDSSPMYAILTGGTTNNAYFYEAGGRQLFTYTLSNANTPAAKQLTFDLSDWNADQASIPADAYPSLQNITYNLDTHSISGACAASSSNVSCVNGTFTPDTFLPLNLTSTVPLGNSSSSSSSAPFTSRLGPGPREILFESWTEAGLILRQLDPSQHSDEVILRTAVHRLYHCRELKVCINGVSGRGLVGAEVLVPMGFLFQQHAQYASWCFERRWSTGQGPDP